MVDIMDKIQSIKELCKSTKEKQRYIYVSEVFYVWDIMVAKLDMLENIQIINGFIDDVDLRNISGQVVYALQTGIDHMEEIMTDYGVPFPVRPPAGIKTTIKLEHMTDKQIYQVLFETIQSFFPMLAEGYMQSSSPKVLKGLKKHLLSTMEVHELLIEYGKLKGYFNLPPVYNV